MVLLQVNNLQGPFRWSDALAVAETRDNMWVISSPNMAFIPSPPAGLVKVILRSDCRYGAVDPIQWPQVFSEGWEYLCMVRRPVSPLHRLAPLWWTPAKDDFVFVEGSTIRCLGLLKWSMIQPLSCLVDDLSALIEARASPDDHLGWLHLAFTQARDRLKRFPCTFRDVLMQVREIQRYWLMARAFIDYYDNIVPAHPKSPTAVDQSVMGAFSSDPTVVQKLYATGIPVWFMRLDASILPHTCIRSVVKLTPPIDICDDHGPEDGTVLYSGLAGPNHLRVMARGGRTYLDISRAPLLAVDADGGYHATMPQKEYKTAVATHSSLGLLTGPSSSSRSTGGPVRHGAHRSGLGGIRGTARSRASQSSRGPHRSQIRGVNKFEPVRHAWMPPCVDSWRDSLGSVDLSAPARPSSEIWGYWIPEAGLMLRPSTEDRLHRYIMNWIRIRPAWLYLLQLREARVTRIPTQWWRDVLYGETGREKDDHTRNGRQWTQIREVFGDVFEDATYVNPQRCFWFRHGIDRIDARLCPSIVWELCELGFRHELLALDRLLVPSRSAGFSEEHREDLLARIFPDRSIFNVAELPDRDTGLGATLPHRRVPYLEALRIVLSRWPHCPASIHAASPIGIHLPEKTILEQERALADFYVNVFFEYSGRAPIVPHRFPEVT